MISTDVLSLSDVLFISLDEVVLERGLHISHDQFHESVAWLKTISVKPW